MTVEKIDPAVGPQGRHLVINATTGEHFACDTLEEAHSLAHQHGIDAGLISPDDD